LSLRAPLAVPVEIRAPKARRVFRLAWNVGEDGMELVRGSTFERGRPVDVRFPLPDGEVLTLRAEVTGADGDAEDDALVFIDASSEARESLRRYVHDRLKVETET
jgi:hypothetical protein